jgi:hypothetical protein
VNDDDQEYAIIFGVCVEKIKIRRERNLREFLEFDLKWFCYAVMIRV